MLNKNGERELAYVARIEDIRPIPNYDRVEHALIGAGWWVIVKKDEFKIGDLCIYFEVDSRVPEKEPFMFLEQRHFKVKTLKMCKVISQGLIMSAKDFGGTTHPDSNEPWIEINNEIFYEGSFLTKKLGVTYADIEDNTRKGKGPDKYAKMAQRHPNIFKKGWARWLMKREWGRRLMFFFFGKKKDKRGWPAWVKKTDEERCQNMPWLFNGAYQGKWIATEKIDGTSTTFTMRGYGSKREFYICSRNVVFDKPDKKCFYDSNVYVEMAEKYDIERIMSEIMAQYGDLDFLTIQGETYGEGIQKRDYSIKGHNFAIFNIIYGFKDGRAERLNPIEMTDICEYWGLPAVPIVAVDFELPATCDELLEFAASEVSILDGKEREGIVLRSYDGVNSFKAVSNSFLLKYHG